MENSSLPEFLEKANKNFYSKQAGAEYNSLIPEMQSLISQMYKVPEYNYYSIDEMPNLSAYNVNYSKEDFENYKIENKLEETITLQR